MHVIYYRGKWWIDSLLTESRIGPFESSDKAHEYLKEAGKE